MVNIQSITDFIFYTECFNFVSEMEHRTLHWTSVQAVYIFPAIVCEWVTTNGDSYPA